MNITGIKYTYTYIHTYTHGQIEQRINLLKEWLTVQPIEQGKPLYCQIYTNY